MKKIIPLIICSSLFLIASCSKTKQDSHSLSSSGSDISSSEEISSSSSSEEVVALKMQSYIGGFKVVDNSLTTSSSNNLGIVTNYHIDKGHLSTLLTVKGEGDAGIIFNSESYPKNYYSLFITTYGGNQLKLTKKVNNEEVVLRSCYITAGYSKNATNRLSVDFDNGDIKCFFNESMLLSYQDDSPLSSNCFGFFSRNSGTTFENVYFSKDKQFKTVDTLIIGHSYMELWSNYKEDLSRYKDIMNIGIGGTATNDWIGHRDEVKAYHPNRLIYMIGINDYPRGTSASQIIANIKTLIDGVLLDLPEVQICLVSVNQCPTHVDYKTAIKETNDLLKVYVSNNDRLYYGDLDNAFLKEDQTPDPNCFVDGLHPTSESYKVIAQAIYDGFDGKMPPLPPEED